MLGRAVPKIIKKHILCSVSMALVIELGRGFR
jgi:hypothetical protein